MACGIGEVAAVASASIYAMGCLDLCDETRTHDAMSFPVEGSKVAASSARYPSFAGYTAYLRRSAVVLSKPNGPTLHHRITHKHAVTRILRKHARLTHVHLRKVSTTHINQILRT
jgi:hypothetical protein